MNQRIETHADVLQRWAARYCGALVSQKRGVLSWMAMAGRSRDKVCKGHITLRSNSVFSLRPAMRDIKGLHESAVISDRAG